MTALKAAGLASDGSARDEMRARAYTISDLVASGLRPDDGDTAFLRTSSSTLDATWHAAILQSAGSVYDSDPVSSALADVRRRIRYRGGPA